ncbi:CLUMA_CG009847, isoform A [Clunio marinus]|uniref:CLUMA_CG009847, isoform A n=1 Tax=Clunio marinus TaxID=568069 RepID=A0A1J1I7Z0_9DIPT|nr:CLUMA_CG009847, isoform A [Clunio marinus]
MPCENCNASFNIFKRKKSCFSCQRLYCTNCLGKRKKNVCFRCEIFLQRPAPSKKELMELKTKDLIFYLQSKKINIAGIVEKEELANLIINHVNSNSYYDTATGPSSTSTTPNHDFDNYQQSFDHLKQTCQNLFTSISDKITSDFQKTPYFNNNQQSQQANVPTTQQPRRTSQTPTAPTPNSTNFINRPQESRAQNSSRPSNHTQSSRTSHVHQNQDCDCSDDEIDEISEKRQNTLSIDEFNTTVASSPMQTSNSNDITRSFIPDTATNTEIRRLTRRRSDSSLLSLRKSNSITIDASSLDTSQVKKLKISCNKCGKAKSKIKSEILKLSEQLKASNKSEAEINTKIKEFLDYLESKSQPSEMTETENSQNQTNQNEEDEDMEGARYIPHSRSHDEIEENIFDENEGINVYPSVIESETFMQASTSTPKRFISLSDIQSSDELETLNVKQLKEILMLNRVDFKGCCEKNELKERVLRLWQDHITAPPSEKLPSDDLCKICMDAPIECVFLECGHMATCTACGKILSECPICRSYIVRVVRIFKS